MHVHYRQYFNTVLCDEARHTIPCNTVLTFDDDEHAWECDTILDINESKVHIQNMHSLRSIVLNNIMQGLL